MKFKTGDKVRTTEDYNQQTNRKKLKGIVEEVTVRSGSNDLIVFFTDDYETKKLDNHWLELDDNVSFDIDYHCEEIKQRGFSYIPDTMSEWKERLSNRDYKQLAYVLSLAKWKYMRSTSKTRYKRDSNVRYCGLCIYQEVVSISWDYCKGCRLNDPGCICCCKQIHIINLGERAIAVYNRIYREYCEEFAVDSKTEKIEPETELAAKDHKFNTDLDWRDIKIYETMKKDRNKLIDEVADFKKESVRLRKIIQELRENEYVSSTKFNNIVHKT